MLKKTFAFATVATVLFTVAVSGVRAETRDVVHSAIADGSVKTFAKALVQCHPRHRFSHPAEGPLAREVTAERLQLKRY
jgi:hypothetical protein